MKFLVIFISTLTLFVIGSLVGWLIELFFRRIVHKKWVNPGFLVGPYLPIYGVGTVCLYGLSNIDLHLGSSLSWLDIIIKILLIAVVMVLVEYIVGLIFIKGMKIQLWDYSDQKGNIGGIICPLFSFLWLLVGALYYFFVNPYLVKAVYWLADSTHQIYYFFIGIVIGMIVVDFCYSMHLATKLTKAAKKSKIVISLDKFKQYVHGKEENLKQKFESNHKIHKPKTFFFFLKHNKSTEDLIEDYQQDEKENNLSAKK